VLITSDIDEDRLLHENQQAKLFRSLADPTRIAILQLLSTGQRSVKEIALFLGCSHPAARRMLTGLRWSEFVEMRRDGNEFLYSLRDDRIRQILRLSEELLNDDDEEAASHQYITAIPSA